MAVDKNLFLYDLAVVAIMKNEGPYAKEWIDYHLLAGVDHFYLYDNDSPDNLKDVLQPYIDAGIVTYTFFPGKCRQMEAYNDAVKRFRFSCRYIAWIDADEFIFPQSNRGIVEVVDEVLLNNPTASGLAVNINNFGSSYHNTANYTRGVMQRFTHRADTDAHVSTIANPRKIAVFHVPHCAQYFEGCHAINENGGIVPGYLNTPPTSAGMVMNHYTQKSYEEWSIKVGRGNADHFVDRYKMDGFTHKSALNKIFDDSILDYVKARRDAVQQQGGGGIQYLIAGKAINYTRLFSSLIQNLAPTFGKVINPQIFVGRLETFMTCLALSTHLRATLLDDDVGKFFEEASLKAVHKTFATNVEIADIRLLLSELPNILQMPYPVVGDIRRICSNIIPQLMHIFRVNNIWKEFTDLDYLQRLLRVGG